MKTKICSKCKKRLPIIDFYNGNDKNGFDYRCKDCHKKYAIKNNKRIISYRKVYNMKNKKKIALHDRIYSLSPEGIYSHIKSGAKIRKMSFKLTKEQFISWYNKQEQKCHYCKRTIKQIDKIRNRKYDRLSIDRKDNDKGYELDNIVLGCMVCNTIKWNIFTYKEMLQVGKILIKKYNGLKGE